MWKQHRCTRHCTTNMTKWHCPSPWQWTLYKFCFMRACRYLSGVRPHIPGPREASIFTKAKAGSRETHSVSTFESEALTIRITPRHLTLWIRIYKKLFEPEMVFYFSNLPSVVEKTNKTWASEYKWLPHLQCATDGIIFFSDDWNNYKW